MLPTALALALTTLPAVMVPVLTETLPPVMLPLTLKLFKVPTSVIAVWLAVATAPTRLAPVTFPETLSEEALILVAMTLLPLIFPVTLSDESVPTLVISGWLAVAS